MACDDSGRFRMLEEGENPKENEVLFVKGEIISLKGRIFELENIFPNPENRLILRSINTRV